MWPWEHVVVGYLAYSAVSHVLDGRAPSGRAAIAVAFAALLPDLVDKPLAWGLDVLPSGRSLAHSLVVAVPTVVAVLLVTDRLGRRDVGVAFGIGYLLHPPADAIYPAVLGKEVSFGFLFWPLVPIGPGEPTSVSGRLSEIFADLLELLSSPLGLRLVLLDAGLVLLAVVIWVYDGMPGLGIARAFVRRQARA